MERPRVAQTVFTMECPTIGWMTITLPKEKVRCTWPFLRVFGHPSVGHAVNTNDRQKPTSCWRMTVRLL